MAASLHDAKKVMAAMSLPDKWFVKRITASNNERAWWIAANPHTGEGKVFARDEWDDAVAYANERSQGVES